MTKSIVQTEQHKVIIIFLVSLVAIFAIISANSSGNAALDSVECETVEICEQWDWSEIPELFCEERVVVDYDECVGYEVGDNGQLVCTQLNKVLDVECSKWADGVVWTRECAVSVTKTYC